MKSYSRHASVIAIATIGAMSMAAIAAPAAKGGEVQSHYYPSTGLVRVVQDSTQSFRSLSNAEAAGYGLGSGCTSGGEQGAMGVHYGKPDLFGDGQLDATQPEILVYEPTRSGDMRLVAVEYIVFADLWNASNAAPPSLLGQQFHYQGSPNRYGLPAAYILHVWAWKYNPNGMFANWNSRVSCEYYAP